MQTKFIRKRNVNTSLPFNKGFARVQVHPDGGLTFKFTKKAVSTPSAGDNIQTEAGLYLTNESSVRLITG